jgi:PilZ domain
MTTNEETRTSSDRLMYRLVLQAETDFNDDRRSEKRFPFFRPVTVQVDGQSFSAFSRDISASGIGLLHNMELPLKDVVIIVDGHRQGLRARVVRCESLGEGWYISGCKIVSAGA